MIFDLAKMSLKMSLSTTSRNGLGVLLNFLLSVSSIPGVNNELTSQLHYSPSPPPSENFIPCSFNPLCACKVDQRTEIYESLAGLWQSLRFNLSEYRRDVSAIMTRFHEQPI